MQKKYAVRPKSPCAKECEFRELGCRSKCELFKQYEQEHSEYLKEKQSIAKANSDFADYKKGIINKTIKRTKKV